ncbi:metallo-beta-lactamase domain protein [Sphingobacterium spiritivorum ATCC 33300]|uniref:Metallo-beta-lactamase domain protein n=1 Tax=Sphingobacterium spiritivorum ATCC 33300 TaxID=525372 RepID=C2FW76_SPHSI|nr:MBL fold metallo-hydrolase [Sphingobacterium spiritivorum]EEI92856.1 metallo-beta-lactamase domain protein [Sphingobacterium spiritivorum ATCC 33300]QQS96401.1 MBL fold metallo-hydrolase [Sphingobacterium spiritivorum]
MKITFLGTGTSQGVPVIACHCEVCQSADPRNKRLRSSVMIEFEGNNIVIDTGPDFRYQMLREEVNHLDAILMTHSHKDHIAGLDDVRAFNYQQKQSIPIYGTQALHEALKREFYYAFSDIKYPGVPQLELREIDGSQSFHLYGKEIIPIEVMHFKMPVLGYRIANFAYITDAKTVSDESVEKLKGVEYLVINALQKEPHISHFTLEEAISFADKVNAKQTYLTHISHRLGLHEEVSRELPDHIELAYDGLSIKL